MERFRSIDWGALRRDAHNVFTKLIRTRDPRTGQEIPVPGRQRLTRCLTTMDLTSLGVGSCVGTGMYLVAGMVARKFAGPGVALSFIIAAVASIFSGACYAEFGVRVPNTTGSAYTYSYVTVGEFIAFVIGWNMALEYLIGTSACARALSACFDALLEGSITKFFAARLGTFFGKPLDFVAFGITILMMLVLLAGVKKSLVFNNILNSINMSVWVFIMGAGVFYVDTKNWSQHKGFLPNGWAGVFSGAATCFYAFIGFDIIATTGEEAHNPKRSIPLAIVLSLAIILLAYVSSSIMLTLIVPYDEIDTESALVQMFAHVNAPTCKYIVALGAISGLTVSMFGSMFPLPRVLYAMAQDGLIFTQLGQISETAGTPAVATLFGGVTASFVSLVIQLEVLVEMMSIGTLLAYTLVSTCVLVLRYQPHSTNLIELLPHSLRTPVDPHPTTDTVFAGGSTHIMTTGQRVMVRRVTRSSPDSDDSIQGDESEEYGRDDTYLMNTNAENKYYVPGSCSAPSRCSRIFDAVYRRLQAVSYLCPGLLPWVDLGPATEESEICVGLLTGQDASKPTVFSSQRRMYVIKAVGVMYALIVVFDLFAAYGSPGECTFTAVIMTLLFIAILIILLAISRRPQNRAGLVYAAPGLPFVPAIAVTVNIYLILNLSVLTLIRFTVWMAIGLVVYFKYGIKNSKLETTETPPEQPPPPNPLSRTTIPPPPPPSTHGDRNIFEGDGNGMYSGHGNDVYSDPLMAWHTAELQPAPATNTYKQVETRYNTKTNSTSSHASNRPPWAYPGNLYDNWDE